MLAKPTQKQGLQKSNFAYEPVQNYYF